MAAGLMSCAKEISEPEKKSVQKEGVPMTFNVTVNETKADKTGWANGDMIYVFFNGLETKYLVLTYDGSEWADSSGGGALLDADFDGLGTKTLTAVHFPVAVDVTYADSKFSFTNGGKPVYNYYLCETDKAYTVSGNTVTATLSMGKPSDMVQIHVAGIQANVSDYTFGCSKIKPVACASVGTDGTITENELSAEESMSGFADADGVVFAGRLTTLESTNYRFNLINANYIYTLTRTAKALTAGKMYNFPAPSVTGGSNWNISAVNLGFTVGGKTIYWAKCNLGASDENEFGDYFAWGETIPYYQEGYSQENPCTHWIDGKKDYSWKYYSLCDGTGSVMDKYNVTDNRTTLDKGDDAAYAALGGKFRMPTKAEFDELVKLANTTREWDTVNGINGLRFTGKGSYNDKSIFFPAAGRRYDTHLYAYGSDANLGFYWSSSIYTSVAPRNRANRLYFSGPGTDAYTDSDTRYTGNSIRPVWVE